MDYPSEYARLTKEQLEEIIDAEYRKPLRDVDLGLVEHLDLLLKKVETHDLPMVFKGPDGRYYGLSGVDPGMSKGDRVALLTQGKKAVSFNR